MTELISIGQGATADVYYWQDNDVLKLFKKGYESRVDKEFSISKQIMKTGLRVPKVKEKINYNGNCGIVYERINGSQMYSEIMKQLEKIEMWGRMFAEIQYEIHGCSEPSLPSPRDEISHAIKENDYLDLELKEKISMIFQSLSDEAALCHGDFHPLNVMITDDGHFIIDWTNSKSFHPLADVAMSSTILQVAGFPEIIQKDFHEAYIRRYLELSSHEHKSLLTWQIPIAVARLSENKENERKAILQLIENNIKSISQ